MDEDGTEFPLQDLDHFTLNEVYKHLTLIDLFELSFTTNDVRSSMRETSIPIKSIFIHFDSRLPFIQLKSAHSELSWTFGYPDEVAWTGEGEYKICQFNYQCKRSAMGYHTQHYDVEHGMIAIIRHLVSIFDCSESIIEELSVDTGMIEDSRATFENFTKFKSIKRLALHQSTDRDRNNLSFAQNLDWILSTLKINEIYMGLEILEHRLVRTPGGDFDFREIPMRLDKTLKMNHICLKFGEWITSEDFLNLDVETAILQNHKLTEKDINAFIKKWLNSTSNKLCWLEIDINETFDKEKITEGLELQEDTYKNDNTKCSCPYRRYNTLEAVPFEFPNESKQITRANNQGIASISITDEIVFFHVKDDGPITRPPPLVVEPTEEERMLQNRMREVDRDMWALIDAHHEHIEDEPRRLLNNPAIIEREVELARLRALLRNQERNRLERQARIEEDEERFRIERARRRRMMNND